MSEKKNPPLNDGQKKPEQVSKQTPPPPAAPGGTAAPGKPAAPAAETKPSPGAPPSPPANKPAESTTAGHPANGADTPPPATDSKAAAKTTPPPVQRAPAEPPAKRGNGLSLIALAVSVAALAFSGYQSLQHTKRYQMLDDANQENAGKIASADSKASENTQAIAAIRAEIAAAQGMDRDSVTTLIRDNNVSLNKNIEDKLVAVQAAVDSHLATLPEPLARNDVQSLIKQEIATFAQTLDGNRPALDFSEEIAKVQASEAAAKQTLAQIEQSAAQLDTRIQQALSDAERQLQDVAGSRQSLLSLLSLAQLAGHAGQYQSAAHYLQQAHALLGAEHAAWQGAVNDAAQYYQELAGKPAPAAVVDTLILEVETWPLRASGKENPPAPDNAQESASFLGKVRQIGSDILESTVTVTPLDDEGLAWINHNPALQNIIRQNVRLDLAFARNALQMQDKAAFTAIAATLKGAIERYFDTGNAAVANALVTLDSLAQANTGLPDLAPVIRALRSAP